MAVRERDVPRSVPAEGEEPGPEDVVGGEEDREEREDEERPVIGVRAERRIERPEEIVLREESRGEREPREGQRAQRERGRGEGHRLAEPAHLEQVLRSDGVDHRARGEEEERLEERVGEEVEHPHHRESGSDGEDHVAELGDRRVGDDPFDVGVHQGHRRGEEGGEAAYPDDGELVGRGEPEEEGDDGEQVDPGRDHRRRVDERAHGRRALHRIGKPDVERELGGLPGSPGEHHEARDGQRGRVAAHHAGEEGRGSVDELEAARGPTGSRAARRVGGEIDEDPEQEEDVPDPRHEERLLGRARRARLLVVEADQEVGADPDQLPEEEELEQVIGEDESGHRRQEERELRVVAREAVIVVHVIDRVEQDEETDDRHHEEHQRRDRVHEDPDVKYTEFGKVPGDPGTDQVKLESV